MSRRIAVWLSAVAVVPALTTLPSLASTTGTSAGTSATTDVVRPLVTFEALPAGGLQSLSATDRLVGVTWTAGDASIDVRWHGVGGWSDWDDAENDSLAPERSERAGTVSGTEPLWRPDGADLVQVRVAGDATGLRLVTVQDGTAQASRGPATSTDAQSRSTAQSRNGTPLLGGVRSRADWGAAESKRGEVSYADRVDAVVVHHTAQGNAYDQADVPRLIRADYAYHVQARGWSDLGYNLVVDRFGGIWEGRAGGLGRPTIGAHAQGFNTRTVGVALLGDMTKGAPTAAVIKAMARVGAYAAATWRFDPQSSATLTSRGSPRYPSGQQVRLPRVFGHQDTGRTSCPGALQDRLADIRRGAAVLLGPAPGIRSVTVTGAPVRAPIPVVIRAELTESAPWSVAIRNEKGRVVRRTAGTSATAELQWHGFVAPDGTDGAVGAVAVLPAPQGKYTWAVEVDDGMHRPARRTGAIDVGPPGPL